MSGDTWRDMAAPIIAGVIAEVGTGDAKALRKALHDAYPFGQRAYWPYKVWCDEARRQRGLKASGLTPRERAAQPDLFAGPVLCYAGKRRNGART